jgi:uncharacterized Zn-finger protein
MKSSCEICGKEFKRLMSLARHFTQAHNIDSNTYYDRYHGFLNDIDIEVISNINNLRIIDAIENMKKHADCDMTIELLLEMISSE